MSDTLVQDLTITLYSICSHVCETENTREVTVTPYQLWSAAKFAFAVSEEEVKANFKEVVESYASLITVYKSAVAGRNISIRNVEKYIINGETDVPFDEVESVAIKHTQEYFNHLLPKNVSKAHQ